ncbi:MAG: peptidoglycan-binding protein [Candidatus Pacearchaeota archaeon]|nr:peptidoglycan-binding protein [Candidatus Pacearchaeota archaeon]
MKKVPLFVFLVFFLLFPFILCCSLNVSASDASTQTTKTAMVALTISCYEKQKQLNRLPLATINTTLILTISNQPLNQLTQRIICSNKKEELCKIYGTQLQILDIVDDSSLEEISRTKQEGVKELSTIIMLYNQIRSKSNNIKLITDLHMYKEGEMCGSLEIGEQEEILTIGNDRINLPPKSKVIFINKTIKIGLEKNSKIKTPQLLNLNSFDNLLEIKGENITLPWGGILQKGTINYHKGEFFLKEGDTIILDNIKLSNKMKERLYLYFDQQKKPRENYISLSKKEIVVSGDNISLAFLPNNPYIKIKGGSFDISVFNGGRLQLKNIDKEYPAQTAILSYKNNNSLIKIKNGNSYFSFFGDGRIEVENLEAFPKSRGVIPLKIEIQDSSGKNLIKVDDSDINFFITEDIIGYGTSDIAIQEDGKLFCETEITNKQITENQITGSATKKQSLLKKATQYFLKKCATTGLKIYSKVVIEQNSLFDGKYFPDVPESIIQKMIIDKNKLERMYNELNTYKFKKMSYEEKLNHIFKIARKIASDEKEYLRLVAIFSSNYKHLRWVKLIDQKTGKLINSTKYKKLVPEGPEQDKVYRMLIAAGARMYQKGWVNGVFLRLFHIDAEVGSTGIGMFQEELKEQGIKIEKYRWDVHDIGADFAGTDFAEKLSKDFDGTIEEFNILKYLPNLKMSLHEKLEKMMLPGRGYYKQGDGYSRREGYIYNQVKIIQELVGISPEERDGKYGPKTFKAVKEWQEKMYKEKGFCAGKFINGNCVGDGLFGPYSLALARCFHLNNKKKFQKCIKAELEKLKPELEKLKKLT